MKFTIFKRLTFGYIAIMVMVVFLGAQATFWINKLNGITRDITAFHGTTIRLTERLLKDLFSLIGFEKKYIVSKDPDFYKQFWEINDNLEKDMLTLAGLMNVPEKKKLYQEAETLYERYISLFREESEFITKKKDYPHKKYQAEKDILVDSLSRNLKQITQTTRMDRDKKIDESSQIGSKMQKMIAATAGLFILVGFLISYFNTQKINRSIVLLQEKTKEIAKGTFEEISNITSPPEIKELADDFNIMCERLRELDEMKIDFISHVSHELRTPLTAMKEASSMLLEGTVADSAEKQKELLEIMYEECTRLIESVNRILDLSRMEAKMMNYHFNECSLVPLIQKSIHKLGPIAKSKKIQLKSKVPQDLPTVTADERQIEQVLENILGNALKFASDQDTVSIDAAVKNDGRRFVEISVSDSGSGIPKKELENIFDKFQRIDNGKGTVRGTGLGLPLAKHIVAAHGGRIWAESEAGAGSTFYFTLPA